jgi:hypothetical protein
LKTVEAEIKALIHGQDARATSPTPNEEEIMKTVQRFYFPGESDYDLDLPAGAEILGASEEALWVLAEPMAAAGVETVRFVSVEPGESPEVEGFTPVFVGVQLEGVFLFRLVPSPAEEAGESKP